MSRIIVLGKKELPKGFTQRTERLPDNDFWDIIDKMKSVIPRGIKLRTTSMALGGLLEEFKGELPPTIIKYSKELDVIFDPIEIFNVCRSGESLYRPSANVAIFKNKTGKPTDRVAFAACSRTEPVLCFEDHFGNTAIGTILVPQLIKHGEWIFQTINQAMLGPTALTIPLSSNTEYPGIGKVSEYIASLASKFINLKKVEFWPAKEDYFGLNDNGCNAVIVF